jgi:membrane fusion protein, heavy metal efflux system
LAIKVYRMKTSLYKKIVIACVIAAGISSCGPSGNKTQDQEEPAASASDEINFTADQYRMAGIQVGKIEKRDLSNIVKVNGVIDVEPENVITISAPLGGYVRSAGLLPGQAIRKGQVLATLENPEFINLQQEYLESMGKLQFTEQEYQRQQKLRDEDVNSAKTFQQVTSDYKVLQARIRGLEAKLKLAGIDMSGLGEGKISSVARLYSPINGIVKSSNINIGKYVLPTDVMFELSDNSDLHVALNIFDKDIGKIRVGQRVRFGLSYEDNYSHAGQIFLIGQATGDDRTIPVHCHFSTPSTKFLPGMYVKAWIETGTESQFTLPSEAILQSEGEDVIVIEISRENDYHFKIIPVKKGIEQGAYAAVTLPEDLQARAGELNVVVKGAYSILSALKNTGEEE